MAEPPHEELQKNGTVPETGGPDHHQDKTKRRHSVDRDAQDMVIDSLRSQIQDLISQVSQLNNKLVKSYDRVSDLEDDLHVASANLRTSTVKISQLELERTQHLSALNTGLLVEKTHVTAELNRLMEKATEEAAQRGQAESARIEIEKDLDDLSATLFGQANTMVAEARFAKHLSERKVEDAELALKSAEEAVQLMQTQMQTMQAEREEAESQAKEMQAMMGKGKWVDRRNGGSSVTLRLLNTHSPYQEYMAFLSHLRVLHPNSPSPPAMSTLLPLPFLARLLNEDSEPTVRLDLAPSLNWLSRRSVLAAIHSGQLSIEPTSVASLFTESSAYPSTTVAGVNSSNDNISCALCGVPVFQAPDSRSSGSNIPTNPYNTWSGAFFRKPSLGLTSSNGGTQPPSPTRPSATRQTSIGPYLNSQVYIFRLASTQSTTIASLSIPSIPKSQSQSSFSSPIQSSSTFTNGHHHQNSTSSVNASTMIYPLCMSGWCLARLRTTCTLWAFVRTGIIDKVWEEEIAQPRPPPYHLSAVSTEKSASTGTTGEKPPPIPPRKRGLWGIASAIGERAASWSEGDKEKTKRTSAPEDTAQLPTPPPTHPSIDAVPEKPPARRLPPPLPPAPKPAENATPAPAALDTDLPPAPPTKAPAPPPLPRRAESRGLQASPTPPEVSGSESQSRPTTPTSKAVTLTDIPTAPLSPIRGSHLRSSSQAAHPPPLPPRGHGRTPSTVPLPDSRPGTPIGGTVVPSRTASPAPHIVGSAAPPPLPRRAAARTRVAVGPGSRSGTPVNLEPVSTSEGEEGKQTEPPRSPPPPPTVAEDTSADQTTPHGELGDRAMAASPGSDEFVDAPTPGQEVDEPAAIEPTEDSDGEEEPQTPIVRVSGESDRSEADQPESEYLNDLNDASSVHEELALYEEHAQERKRKEEEGAKACYVGYSSWEEKAWRELMRLREDMFWARVGGIRD